MGQHIMTCLNEIARGDDDGNYVVNSHHNTATNLKIRVLQNSCNHNYYNITVSGYLQLLNEFEHGREVFSSIAMFAHELVDLSGQGAQRSCGLGGAGRIKS